MCEEVQPLPLGGNAMEYTAITKANKIKELYEALFEATKDEPNANSDPSGEFRRFEHKHLDLALYYTDTLEVRRFGLGRSKGRYRLEVNLGIDNPLRGEGLFVRNANNEMFLTHTGSLQFPTSHPLRRAPAEKKRNGFIQFSQREWITVSGEKRPRYLVTPLDVGAEQILKNLKSTLEEVIGYKDSQKPSPNGKPDDDLDDFENLCRDLLFDKQELRRIADLLDDKRQVIFQGPPGTGKTFAAQAIARHMAATDRRVTLVQFHPSYAYEDFVQGFRPKLIDSQPGFELTDGPLLQAAHMARGEPGERHFLIIDEINRGNLAKVFGELYFLLEYRDRSIRLQYSDEPFSLPKNLYIIGTMNTADRSIALVDLALRRRFHFVEFHPDKPPIGGLLERWLESKASDMAWVAGVVSQANRKLDDRQAAIGPSYFMKEGLDDAKVEMIWEHNVLPYIEERLFGERERLADFELKKLRSGGENGTTGEADPKPGSGDEEA